MRTLNMGIVLVATVLPGAYVGARDLLKDLGAAEGHVVKESH